MQTSTFLQKLSFRWFSWRISLPLLIFFVSIGASRSVLGQTYNFDDITINASLIGEPSISASYDGKENPNGTNDPFEKADLGKGSLFDQSKGSLTITAASANLATTSTKPFTASSIFYKVYLSNTPLANQPGFSQLSLTQTSTGNASDPVTFALNNTTIDLLNQPAVLGGGTYVVEIVYSSTYSQTSRNGTITYTNVIDPGNIGGTGYRATFSVLAPRITPTGGVTTWQGNIDSDWTKAGNWTNGVPTATSDAVVQEKTAGSSIVYPIVDQLGYRYAVRNLTLQGDLSSTKALLTVQSAVMRVYGNIRQDAGGLVGTLTGNLGVQDSTSNATLILAGANQIVSGALVMTDVIVAGSGTKSVIGTLFPNNTLSFQPASPTNGVIVQTAVERTVNGVTSIVFSTTGGASIDLRTTGLINQNPGKSETVTSYVKGILLSNRLLRSGINQTFGNIGIELVPNHNSQSNVNIKRVVGDPLIGPTKSGSVQANAIKRQYEITKDDDSRDNRYSNSASDVIFHYLPSADVAKDNNELNGIKYESYLTMFTTTNNGVPFTAVGGVVDTIRHQVSRLALPSIDNYAITLGDRTNPLTTTPLPVVLTAFNASRDGINTQVTWSTASENNSAGFEIQISTNGTYFRKLAFVSSQNGNSISVQNYSYLDTEANKSSIRYYRLRQIDLDGKEGFSPVRAVNFSGVLEVATALSAYPNPYGISDAVKLSVQTTSVGTARLRVSDLMGREVANQTFTTISGVTEVALNKAASLSAGSYLAKVILPSGEVKTVRIQKQ